MRKLYDELLLAGESGIQDLVTQRRQETVDLEFKEKSDCSKGEFDNDDARNLGKELSAFSNSMGGLLVWGVRAKKVASGELDCASSAVPIRDIERFKSEAIRRSAAALMPRHDGIFIESISSATAQGAGYLLVLVERSERRPHRSEVSGDKHYWKRSGDSAMMMEHYDVEDAFKRMTVAGLRVTHDIHAGGSVRNSNSAYYNIMIAIELDNYSEVSARHPYLIVENINSTLQIHEQEQMIFTRSRGTEVMFYTGADNIIHPGLSLKMTTLRFHIPMRLTEHFPQSSQGFPSWEHVKPLSISYRCGCDNSRAISSSIEISLEAMQRALSIA